MATPVTATLDANAEEVGPVFVRDRATYLVRDVSGTITVTPHYSHDGSNYEADTTEALVDEAGSGVVTGPVWVKLVASSVSVGSAVGSILNSF